MHSKISQIVVAIVVCFCLVSCSNIDQSVKIDNLRIRFEAALVSVSANIGTNGKSTRDLVWQSFVQQELNVREPIPIQEGSVAVWDEQDGRFYVLYVSHLYPVEQKWVVWIGTRACEGQFQLLDMSEGDAAFRMETINKVGSFLRECREKSH